MADSVDPFVSPSVEEPPTETPQPGQIYQRLADGPAFPVVDCDWQHPAHETWAEIRERRGLAAPFYVRSPKGTIGWVPWPGSVIVWPSDHAWVMDLLDQQRGSSPVLDGLPTGPVWKQGQDLRPSERKKK